MMRNMLEVTFTGDVGDAELDQLRASLSLAARGRLSDDWDAEFGRRELRPPESGWIYLILIRDLEREGWWKVALKYEVTPLLTAEVDRWEQQIINAVTEVGLTVREIRR